MVLVAMGAALYRARRVDMALIFALIGVAMWQLGYGLVSVIGLIVAIGFGIIAALRLIAILAEIFGW
jgi:EamA domain-containing membrane protein RarD